LLNIEAPIEWENLPTKLHPDYEAMKVVYDKNEKYLLEKRTARRRSSAGSLKAKD